MEKVRVGVIGAGKMGILHCCLFNKLEHSQLVAICDKTPRNLKLLGSVLPKVRLFDDYEKMINEVEMDLVVITTPVFLHKRMAMKALEHGAAVFVEKPLAINGDECMSLVEKGSGKVTYVGYCRRFMGTYNLVKKIIDSRELGSVISFQSHMFVTQFSDKREGWQYDARQSGGGVVMDLGSHAVDMAIYLFGNIQDVSAKADKMLSETVEDHASLNLKFNSGIVGAIEVSWSMSGYRLPELLFDIKLEGGRVKVCEKNVEIIRSNGHDADGEREVIYKQSLESGVQIDIAGQDYTREDEHLIDCILNNKTTRCDFKEAAKTNYVIEAAYDSMREKSKWVPPRYVP